MWTTENCLCCMRPNSECGREKGLRWVQPSLLFIGERGSPKKKPSEFDAELVPSALGFTSLDVARICNGAIQTEDPQAYRCEDPGCPGPRFSGFRKCDISSVSWTDMTNTLPTPVRNAGSRKLQETALTRVSERRRRESVIQQTATLGTHRCRRSHFDHCCGTFTVPGRS